MSKPSSNTLWLIKMAWRESRTHRVKLALFLLAIVIGVAAQVSISSLRDNLTQSIDSQSKELLGADLEVRHTAPFDSDLNRFLDSRFDESADMVRFASMVSADSGFTRLSQIFASSSTYPFYGSIKTQPAQAFETFKLERGALIDQSVLDQFNLSVGDTLTIGLGSYPILGGMLSIPGQAQAGSFFGPRIFIPIDGLEETGLLQRGSRVEYLRYFTYHDDQKPEQIRAALDSLQDLSSFGFDDVEERRSEVSSAIEQLSNFLNIIGFIALLLGGLGIGSSMFVYIREKVPQIAILKCVGVKGKDAILIFLFQSFVMGMIGAVLGAFIGVVIQQILPFLITDFLPVELQLFLSWPSVLVGMAVGVLVTLLFAGLPLVDLTQISPLQTLRRSSITKSNILNRRRYSIIGLILLGVWGYGFWMLGSVEAASWFSLGVIVLSSMLMFISLGLMKLTRTLIRPRWPYAIRQGLSNLYRPQNQTTTLLLSFGLGITLISSLYLTQDLLLNALNFSTSDDIPNVAFYDIQADQNNKVNQVINELGYETLQNVPIVTMRLEAIGNAKVSQILADTSRSARRWALQREYRSTYRDSLIETEKLTEGEFIGQYELNMDNLANDYVPITVSSDLMDNLAATIGDTLRWDVQGITISSTIVGIREVRWDEPQPNFFVVFPDGVLNYAPQFFATTVRTSTRSEALILQEQIVNRYPNISALDIGLLIESFRDFLNQITFVIQFIGLFSILTGLIVLAGAAASSRFQRLKEAQLLRVLGAQKQIIKRILFIEFFAVGGLSSLLGVGLSLGVSYLVGYFVFDLVLQPSWGILSLEILIIIGLVTLVGATNSSISVDRERA
ncbi:MAG: hypothetical protein CL672_07595 [Balneola sp.]|nr:hypothetical protein [Balneola sp.]